MIPPRLNTSGLVLFLPLEGNSNDAWVSGYNFINSGNIGYRNFYVAPHGSLAPGSVTGYPTLSTAFAAPTRLNELLFSGNLPEYTIEADLFLTSGYTNSRQWIFHVSTEQLLQIGMAHQGGTLQSIDNDAPTSILSASGSGLVPEQWNHVAISCSKEQGRRRIYVNNEFRGQATNGGHLRSGSIACLNGLIHGSLLFDVGALISGYVKNLAIYNYEKTIFEDPTKHVRIQVPDQTYDCAIYDNLFKPLLTGNVGKHFNIQNMEYRIPTSGIKDRDNARTLLISKGSWVAGKQDISGFYGGDYYSFV